MMRWFVPIRQLVIALLLGCGFPSTTGLSFSSGGRPDFVKIDKSVVNVSSQNCLGRQPQLATGFAWNSPNRVVTALHVVAGCQSISVRSGTTNQTWTASVERVLIKADLALLSVNGTPTFPTLSESNAPVQGDQDLWAWGYIAGAPTAAEQKFLNLSGAKTLKDFVHDDVAQDIKNSGMPDLNIDILYVSGLVPGLSGAPVLDASGSVVGIGDGGLNGGSYGVNWAMPQKYLTQLLSSTDSTTTVTRMNMQQFSYDRPLPSGNGTVINCGAATFRRVPDINLGNALHGTDSPAGLVQLMNVFQVQNPSAITFNGYQELGSGATFVLPQNANLVSDGSGCSANVPGTPITFKIEVRRYDPANINDAIAQRTAFDTATSCRMDVRSRLDDASGRFSPSL
jgi:hypothetical protein